MHQIKQIQHMALAIVRFTHQRQSGRFDAKVNAKAKSLCVNAHPSLEQNHRQRLRTTSLPRGSSKLARFSLHGINGCLCLSSTKTVMRFPP